MDSYGNQRLRRRCPLISGLYATFKTCSICPWQGEKVFEGFIKEVDVCGRGCCNKLYYETVKYKCLFDYGMEEGEKINEQ